MADKKIKSAEQLAQRLDEFIMQCERIRSSPDDFALCAFLGVSPATLDRYYRDDGGKYPGFGEALKKIVAYREARLARMIEANPRAAGGYIFLLKQAKNGGYVDKPTVQIEAQELTIKTDGVGGDDAFK